MNASTLFPTEAHAAFPVCTQVTLNHGICDSRCLSCPIGRTLHGDATPEVAEEFSLRTRRSMSYDLFCTVADEVARYPHAWLRMHARGEPLLHPRFADMVRYAKHAGVGIVQTFTDAISMDARKASALLDAGLDVLECSVHGHTRSYEALMRSGKFEQVKANILRFRQLRDARGARTRLVVSAVDQPLFQVDKAEHRAFWTPIADEVIYRPHHSWGDRVDGVCAALPESRHACSQLWTRCTVSPDGRVLACFNSWSEPEEEVLGDLRAPGASIAAAWTSPKAQQMRQDHAAGHYTLPSCRSCKDWAGSAWGTQAYENLLHQKLSLGAPNA